MKVFGCFLGMCIITISLYVCLLEERVNILEHAIDQAIANTVRE
jgi:hypothetical protein